MSQRIKNKDLLEEFIDWARDCGEDVFYIFEETDEAIKKFFELRLGDDVGRSEQLVCEYCNDDAKPTCCDSCLEGMVNAVQKAN